MLPQSRWVTVFDVIRRVTIFGLGVWIISAALIDPESENTIATLIIGMVMVGILPIEDLFNIRLKRIDRDKQ